MNLITEQLSYFLRILLSCVCGGVIGIERQQRTKVAGTRTHMMIALGGNRNTFVGRAEQQVKINPGIHQRFGVITA